MTRRSTAREDTPGWPGGRALDANVLVAAAGPWHPRHDAALAALQLADTYVSHAMLEAYSVLTRVPPPYRMSCEEAATFLHANSEERTILSLPGSAQRDLVKRCAELGLRGGAIYDAVIGLTCARAKATLLTLDKRARATYVALGVEFQLL